VLHEIIIDTLLFEGNYPPEVSVEATWVDGSPDKATLDRAEWITVVPNSAACGNTPNTYRAYNNQALPTSGSTSIRTAASPYCGCSARLSSIPGYSAIALIWPPFIIGGDIAECSDMFYSDARHMLYPGIAASMTGGWQTARTPDRRQRLPGGHPGRPGPALFRDLDTGYFLGNAPGRVRISARSGGTPREKQIYLGTPEIYPVQ